MGVLRERVIISLLIYKYGEDRVDTDIATTESEIDVKLDSLPISIKSITDKTKNVNRFNGVKLSWTVDAESALGFARNYIPSCDIILAHINWSYQGCLYYIPQESQLKLLQTISRDDYFKLPKQGTNPRGIEISGNALRTLCSDSSTYKITIDWEKPELTYNSYKKWVDLWAQE